MSDENLQKHDLPAAPRTTAFTILIIFWGLCGGKEGRKDKCDVQTRQDIASSESRVAIITIKIGPWYLEQGGHAARGKDEFRS